MHYTEKLKNVSVLGAAGKMGSGILLLTAQELLHQKLQHENKNRKFVLNAIDVSHDALDGLLKYTRAQAQKYAEKKIVQIRKMYADHKNLNENADFIQQYTEDVVDIIKPTTRIEAAYNSYLILEAVSENPELKNKLFKQIKNNNTNNPWFFTNTSSIPIHEIDSNADLKGSIMGVHFYNPPAVQKLVELIKADQTLPELTEFATQYVKNLKKIIVPSADVAGFIGNGHYMRDTKYGIDLATELHSEIPLPQAIATVDSITRDYLVRPMGIFQLADYVGIDVVQYIMKVMHDRGIGDNLQSDLLDKLVKSGIKGGQNSDGSQKDGFFRYEKGRPVAVIDPENIQYTDLTTLSSKIDTYLGQKPEDAVKWKALLKANDKEGQLRNWFNTLKNDSSKGSKLAMEYLQKSKDFALQLVKDGVAANEEDVNTVLMTGFFHAYGPANDFMN
ncbi:putative 3-hydroxybutyryl-CoA dehydrogenase [Salinivirga cyanobacteriivorans]|uniref:Putative 3-hydroxybutyryl-CoA dehydrogenase n=1 Tax=Salinivirga cyanobacteriivorans TaxID=1307839 RepID=A0A0S2I1X9_9BACT|nr:3-hydroxyacyl-CoA dehydrogenase family protein [Salinivirga cyanobacteriivorans]ALO16235.1 putative 3-hydroxybutyryl-CoA dehydrogenase [Salinivirga cyanobacteriivorans]